MLDKFYRNIIDNSDKGYALIKVEYNKQGMISDFTTVYDNPLFKKTFDNNCDLNEKLSNYIFSDDFNCYNISTKKLKWTCIETNLNYTLELSALDKHYISVTINQSVFKETISFKNSNAFSCQTGKCEDCKLEKSEKKYKLLFESMFESFALHEIILDKDKNPVDYIFLDVNSSFEKSTGLNRNEVLGKKISEILGDTTDLYWLTDFGRVALNGDRISFEYNAEDIGKIFEVKAFSPEKYIFAVTFIDITELRYLEACLKEEMRKIEFLSYCDQLTGLYNRRFFEESIKKIDTKDNLPLSMIMIDVNGLKLANDAFGHNMGDKLLIEVSKILKTIFSNNEVVARLGGDEFAVLLPSTDSEKVKSLVSEIKLLSHKSNLHPIKVSMAIGWEIKYDIHENVESILKKSEDYMYKNKMLESQSVKSKTIETIIESLYHKNLLEQEHSKRVGAMCETFARALDLDNTEIEQISMLGTLHDIGKIAIDDKILDKPSKLSSYEFKEIERHSEIGYNILSSVNDMSQIANYVLSHHENFDGTGYPKKLKGDKIPLASRIIKIIDSYDAMTQDRPYRDALSKEGAVAELKKYSGTQFDPELVEVFIKYVLRESL